MRAHRCAHVPVLAGRVVVGGSALAVGASFPRVPATSALAPSAARFPRGSAVGGSGARGAAIRS